MSIPCKIFTTIIKIENNFIGYYFVQMLQYVLTGNARVDIEYICKNH